MRAVVLALALSACASPQTPHRSGPVIPYLWPQTYEQCLHQPTFPGCDGR